MDNLQRRGLEQRTIETIGELIEELKTACEFAPLNNDYICTTQVVIDKAEKLQTELMAARINSCCRRGQKGYCVVSQSATCAVGLGD